MEVLVDVCQLMVVLDHGWHELVGLFDAGQQLEGGVVVHTGVLFVVGGAPLDELLEVSTIEFFALFVGQSHQLRKLARTVGLDGGGNRWQVGVRNRIFLSFQTVVASAVWRWVYWSLLDQL